MRLLTHGNQRTGRAGSSATELTLEEPIECTSLDRFPFIQVPPPALDDHLCLPERGEDLTVEPLVPELLPSGLTRGSPR
jgi:hypothetical protein